MMLAGTAARRPPSRAAKNTAGKKKKYTAGCIHGQSADCTAKDRLSPGKGGLRVRLLGAAGLAGELEADRVQAGQDAMGRRLGRHRRARAELPFEPCPLGGPFGAFRLHSPDAGLGFLDQTVELVNARLVGGLDDGVAKRAGHFAFHAAASKRHAV